MTISSFMTGTRLADRLEEVRVHHQFWEDEVAQIEAAQFFILATATDDAVDCSFKEGAAGFVKVTGPATLEWPDYDGNSVYRSLGNISENPKIGLCLYRPMASRLDCGSMAGHLSPTIRPDC